MAWAGKSLHVYCKKQPRYFLLLQQNVLPPMQKPWICHWHVFWIWLLLHASFLIFDIHYLWWPFLRPLVSCHLFPNLLFPMACYKIQCSPYNCVLFLWLYFPLVLHYIHSYVLHTFSPGMMLCIKPVMPTICAQPSSLFVCPCIYCCPYLAYFCTLKVWWHTWKTLLFNPSSCLTHLVFIYKLTWHFLFTSCVSMHSQLILHAFKSLMYSSKTETDLHISLELVSVWNNDICSITVTCQMMKAACIPLKPPEFPKDYAVSKLGNAQTKFSPPWNFQILYDGLF